MQIPFSNTHFPLLPRKLGNATNARSAVILEANGKNITRFYLLAECRNDSCVALR